jgi:hypothetical protein
VGAYPSDENKKIDVARAWVIPNSSSTIGRTGEKIDLVVKFKNHINHIKSRNRVALPVNERNRFINLNVTRRRRHTQ